MMGCRRSQEIDLPAFLADPRDEAFADFRGHYPGCRDCSAELRVWTELHESLSARHPEPERLARYEQLPAAERAEIDRHTVRCPGCREELAALLAFDPAWLGAAAAAPDGPSLLERLRAALAPVGRVVWHPAFAYALVGLLLLPVVQRLASTPSAPTVDQLFSTANGPSYEGDAVPQPASERLLLEPSEVAEAPVARPSPPPASRGESPDTRARPPDSTLAQREGTGLDARSEAVPGAEAADRAASEAFPGGEAADRAASERARTHAAKSRRAALRVAQDTAEAQGEPGGMLTQGFAGASAETEATLRLESWRTVEAARPRGVDAVRLLVPLPDELPAGELFATIREEEASRERRERIERLPDEAGARLAELRVPGAWLTPGRYRVELEGSDARVLRLRIRP